MYPHSTRLNTTRFRLWGHVKANVYRQDPPRTPDELRRRITVAYSIRRKKVTRRAVGQMRGQRDVSVTWDITLKTSIDTAVTSDKSGFQLKNLVLNSTTSLLFFQNKYLIYHISLFCQRYSRLDIVK